jgi:hypothetical protein
MMVQTMRTPSWCKYFGRIVRLLYGPARATLIFGENIGCVVSKRLKEAHVQLYVDIIQCYHTAIFQPYSARAHFS